MPEGEVTWIITYRGCQQLHQIAARDAHAVTGGSFHLLQDDDPYVRKTAAVCVAKLHDINSELVEDRGFLDTLKVPMLVVVHDCEQMLQNSLLVLVPVLCA